MIKKHKIILFLLLSTIVFAQQRSSSFSPSSANIPKDLRSLQFEQLKLSYIQTDRALAILKTMGYAVVEFRSAKGEIAGESNFTPIFSNYNSNLNSPGALPVIIKLPDTETISLVEKSVAKKALRSSERAALGVDLSGVVMNSTTSGEPMQRLLVGFKPGDYRPIARLRDLIQNQIDNPASQIAIEALVI